MKQKPQPRAKYNFHELPRDAVMSVKIPEDDPAAGSRALCAAYAYGRRNGKQFCGATGVVRNKNVMLIRRVK